MCSSIDMMTDQVCRLKAEKTASGGCSTQLDELSKLADAHNCFISQAKQLVQEVNEMVTSSDKEIADKHFDVEHMIQEGQCHVTMTRDKLKRLKK